MPDTPTSTPSPSNWKATKGFALVALLIFLMFVAAGLGWHAGVALSRLAGI